MGNDGSCGDQFRDRETERAYRLRELVVRHPDGRVEELHRTVECEQQAERAPGGSSAARASRPATRRRALGTAGNTVDQTIIRAYRLK
ncbi:hypothetical protein [Amycolatopsis sp. NPDC051128]|uniref:hypothetical protein n=1 Tax=Amycolatopsis sp. NPDC051128 TaxID=3155412 RepID=UPI003446C98A